MLDRVAEALNGAGASRVTVVSSLDSASAFKTVADIHKGKGALGGIHSALYHSQSEAVFIAACDFPFLSAGLVRLLVDIFDESEDDCVIPVQRDGIVQPLAAVYSREDCLPAAEALLSDSGASCAVRSLLDRVSARYVPFEEYSDIGNADKALLNVNTPEELEAALGEIGPQI